MTETPSTRALTTSSGHSRRLLSAEQFHQLADVPAPAVWLANVDKASCRVGSGSA
ncbi:hypothetical protein [Engelhardtia mirabilis]|uniref:hypothetical protein n=1 Tax=Engelhardtia mirabilis TaxID=2528011 RepID=UPI001189136D|nr:hypothetical protein Pla86_52610 [Planctomycetes bacterium Pla86]